jgi:hypothetical protein
MSAVTAHVPPEPITAHALRGFYEEHPDGVPMIEVAHTFEDPVLGDLRVHRRYCTVQDAPYVLADWRRQGLPTSVQAVGRSVIAPRGSGWDAQPLGAEDDPGEDVIDPTAFSATAPLDQQVAATVATTLRFVPVAATAIAPPEADFFSAQTDEPLAQLVDVAATVGSNFEPMDLRPYLDGSTTQPHPALVPIPGGHLLYEHSMHLLFGESGGGKTWIALASAAAVLQEGGRVLYVDHENGAAAIVARLTSLGVPAAVLHERLTYIVPAGAFDFASMQSVAGLGRHHLAIIDSLGEQLAADGVNPNADEEVARTLNTLRRILCYKLGAAVMLIDHVPKANDADRLQPIGSQRKRAAADAAWRADTVTPLAKGTTGRLKLTTSKDRHGTWQKGAVAAEVVVTSNEDGSKVRATFEAPPAQLDRSRQLQDAVLSSLEETPEGLGVRALRTAVRTRVGTAVDSDIDHAAHVLTRSNVIEVIDLGRGMSKLHRLVTVADDAATVTVQDPLPV